MKIRTTKLISLHEDGELKSTGIYTGGCGGYLVNWGQCRVMVSCRKLLR